jgi:hypothetical protein
VRIIEPLTQEFEPDCVAGVRGLELENVALQNARPNYLVFQNISVPETFRVFHLCVLVNDHFVLRVDTERLFVCDRGKAAGHSTTSFRCGILRGAAK